MKSIPTRWNDTVYRSRLEARWSVFFSAMNMEHWYEPDGMEFTDGTRYLPDFYLPQVKMYGEVKPDLLDMAEMIKAENLVIESRKHLILLVGPPAVKHYTALYWDNNYPTTVLVSLDLAFGRNRHIYDTERRLFTDPGEGFSDNFRDAVAAASAIRFEQNPSTTLAELQQNLSIASFGGAW